MLLRARSLFTKCLKSGNAELCCLLDTAIFRGFLVGICSIRALAALIAKATAFEIVRFHLLKRNKKLHDFILFCRSYTFFILSDLPFLLFHTLVFIIVSHDWFEELGHTPNNVVQNITRF